MNVARPTDGLLSAKLTLALLGLVARHPAGCNEDRTVADLTAIHAVSRSRAFNTISMLRDLGLVSYHDGAIRLMQNSPSTEAHWFGSISNLIAKRLAMQIELAGADCLQVRGTNGLWLDSMLLPSPAEGVPLWVIDFSVASREGTRERFWKIQPQHEKLFFDGARVANRRIRRRISAAALDESLAKQATDGHAAELWVLEYERRRLASHPLADQIILLSQDNVAAGYDIASFSSQNVLQHDLFIEVKSYENSKRFFWTRNEISTAEDYGERYALYLIERVHMENPEYQPEIIRGPHSALFLSADSGWSISPTTYECVPS